MTDIDAIDFDDDDARRIAADLTGKYGRDALDYVRGAGGARRRGRRRHRADDLAAGAGRGRRDVAALTLR